VSPENLEGAADKRAASEPAALKLHPSRLRRSKLASNPMRAVSTNTTRGRLVHDTAVQLLARVADPDNPLVIADIVALAELRVRADELRRDPASDPNVVVKLEGLVDRRMRRLGLGLDRHKAPPAGPSLAEHLAKRAAERAREPAEAAK
jgi:hypothetical protein